MQRDQLYPCLSTIFTDPYSVTPDDFDQGLAAFAAAGSDGVSLWSLHHMLVGNDASAIAAQIAGHGLSVSCIEAIYAWANADSSDAALEHAEPSIQMCADYGASTLVAVVLEPELADADATVANLAAVADRAGEANVSIAIEFLPWTAIADLATCWDIVQRADRDNAGILVDSWHWHHQPGGPNADLLASIPGEAIKLFQLCDAEADPTDDMMTAATTRRPLPGQGVVNHEELFDVFRQIGADPVVSNEVFNTELLTQGMTEAAQQINDASRATLSTW